MREYRHPDRYRMENFGTYQHKFVPLLARRLTFQPTLRPRLPLLDLLDIMTLEPINVSPDSSVNIWAAQLLTWVAIDEACNSMMFEARTHLRILTLLSQLPVSVLHITDIMWQLLATLVDTRNDQLSSADVKRRYTSIRDDAHALVPLLETYIRRKIHRSERVPLCERMLKCIYYWAYDSYQDFNDEAPICAAPSAPQSTWATPGPRWPIALDHIPREGHLPYGGSSN